VGPFLVDIPKGASKTFSAPDKLEADAAEVAQLCQNLPAILNRTLVEGDETLSFWEDTARLVRRRSPDPTAVVSGVWSRETEPTTAGGWAQATRELIEHYWPSHRDCQLHFAGVEDDLEAKAETAHRRRDAIEAARVMNAVGERVDRPRRAAWKRYTTVMAEIRHLQDRRRAEENNQG